MYQRYSENQGWHRILEPKRHRCCGSKEVTAAHWLAHRGFVRDGHTNPRPPVFRSGVARNRIGRAQSHFCRAPVAVPCQMAEEVDVDRIH